jgi:DNA mismatch repair protein MutS
MSTPTPLMQQYFSIKQEYPNALLLFQVGDFYELFFEDAKSAAAFLGIALTKRGTNNGEPIPLCGVPVHALDHYLAKLVRGGFNVVICDQLQEAVPGKMVERGVTRVLTPGTLTDSKLLDEKSASYLFSFYPVQTGWGLLFGELLSAQLFATTVPAQALKSLESEVVRYFPDEVLIPEIPEAKSFQPYFKQLGYYTTLVPQGTDEAQGAARAWMNRHFGRESLNQVTAHEGLASAVTQMHGYLRKTNESALEQFKSIYFYQPEDFLLLDAATQRNLELIKPLQADGSSYTLFSHMDAAITAMGSRTIKKWIQRPLVSREAIEQRLDAVSSFVEDVATTRHIEKLLREIGDLERVVGRIALRRATLQDYLQLKAALTALPALKKHLGHKRQSVLLFAIDERIVELQNLLQELERALNDNGATTWMIKPGYDSRLDHLRDLAHNSHSKIIELERSEQQRTGISSLKIRYNQVSGYYIEVTKPNTHLVPEDYQRQQTLVGRERYTTAYLRQLQGEILTAQQESAALEVTLFDQLKSVVAQHVTQLRHVCAAVSKLDALIGLSLVSYNHNYSRPTFNNDRNILIAGGKHPVIASILGSVFIANDTQLTDEQSLFVITGPNMGGKSTYLRQVALIAIMAQIGCYVPATKASLPLLDRIFTRIGAGDQLSAGKSTFLVEMEETATICSQATAQSLVILDEVGRGTSTFDGLAIAQAVVEFLYTTVKARCLFATHYHELTQLTERFPGIASYYAASSKGANGIMFRYKILPGIADGSFGVEVARLAGLPTQVLTRAQEILEELTQGQVLQVPPSELISEPPTQELALQRSLVARVRAANLDQMTPRQAMELLFECQNSLAEPPVF